MGHKMTVPYLITVLVIISILLFSGCGGSGGEQSSSSWNGGGSSSEPQIQSVLNLNNSGQPVRIGDWCQINGVYFGSSKGIGYVRYSFQDGTSGSADYTNLWADSQIICRVPQPDRGMNSKAAAVVNLCVYTNEGMFSNSYSTDYDTTPNPTPQPTPPSPSPTPSISPTPSPTSTVSPTPSPSPSSSPTPSISPTPSPTSTVSPTPSPSPSPSPTPSISPTPSPTSTISPTPSPSPTYSPSPSPSPSPTSSPSPARQWWDMGNVPKTWQMYPNLRFSSTGTAYVSYDVFDDELNTSLVCFGTFDSGGYHALASIDVGENGGFSSLCLNENNVPYLAWCKSGDVYVGKYKNGAFTTLGTISGASFPSLYVSGVYAYLAYEYQDQGDQYVTAGYFDEKGVWNGFIQGGFNGAYPKLTGVGNTAYMSFIDCDLLVAGCFPDGNWTILGDFESPTGSIGVALDSNKFFYVAYIKLLEKSKARDTARDYSTINVQVYKNGSWTAFPVINASSTIYYPYFFGSPAVWNGAVYLAFSDPGADQASSLYKVKQSLGSSWQDTGSLGFGSPEEPNCYIAIALDNIGTPYVFCIGTDASLHLYKYAVSRKGR
ncbi:MAG: hypothetical protein AB9903_13910 [Vulcanimicrobiota bacterium]